jgi:putative glycosyltransferase
MKLSIVATLYQSSGHIGEFHRRASEVARQVAGDSYEIVLVNDGSRDDSLAVARRLLEDDDHLTVVDLSRNFGHHKAIMTGLSMTRGERVFLIDSDLEEEPEWLAGFMEQLVRDGCDVVYGVQESRKGGLVERLSGRWFYRLFNYVSGLDLPENVVIARLMTRRYVDAVLEHRERELFIVGLWAIAGFDQRPCPIRKHATSESTYTLRKKLALAINAITSFSNTPLIWIFNVGLFIALVSMVFVGYLIFNWLFLVKPPSGWTSVLASIWLVGGLVISFIGVVGIYLSKIFSEVKQRPYTIIRNVYRSDDRSSAVDA